MNKDLKLIAEAYEDGVWNKAIKQAQGYKPQLDHIHVSRYIQYKDDEVVYKVEEHTKRHERISTYYYQPKPEAWNDDPDMILTSTDISRILPDEIKNMVRKEVEELELKKMGLDQEERDTWRGVIGNL